MLTYSFSKREKVLLVGFAIILLAAAWYNLVFKGTVDEVMKLDGQIATIKSEITTSSAQITKMNSMNDTIEKSKEEGIEPQVIPEYDNSSALMEEFNKLLSSANSYTVTFGNLDFDSNDEYVLRTAKITFGAGTYEEAETIIKDMETGKYPCVVKDFSITTNNSKSSRNSSHGAVATVNLTFIEKK